MLRWQTPPDRAFTNIVTVCLELSIDDVEMQMEYDTDNDEILAGFYSRIRSTFKAAEVVRELKKLLQAHQSYSLYMPTDYHFLLLHSVLCQGVDLHNDSVTSESKAIAFFGGLVIGQIDFALVSDIYFWDEDFLFTPEQFDMTTATKQVLGFSDETFAVVHQMTPHPDDLALKLVKDQEPYGEGDESLYRPGEPYPALSAD